MAAMIDVLRRHVDSGDVPGLVAVVARGDDVDVTVIGDLAIENLVPELAEPRVLCDVARRLR